MNGYLFALIFVPLMAFMLVVLPTWLVFHYRERSRQSHTLTGEEWRELRGMLDTAERLERRLAALETILDRDHPGWRNAP